MVSPQESGTFVITANLFGQFYFAVLTVFDNYQFTSLKNENNLIPMVDNYNNAVAINNVLTGNVLSNKILVGDGANYQSDSYDSSIGDDNQSNSNSPVKSISQSKTILNNNNLYFLLLIVLVIIFGGFLIKKMKK